MIDVLPSIIVPTIREVQEKLDRLKGIVPVAHIDIMDGRFVPAKTEFLPGDLAHLATDLELEIHLMVEEPEKVAETWGRERRVNRVLVHSEVIQGLDAIVEQIQGMNKEVGIVLNIGTSLSRLDDALPLVQSVMFMGIQKVGYGGQQFDESILPQIEELHDQSQTTIAVDGGVNGKTAPQIVHAGVTRLITGSYLFDAESQEELEKRVVALQQLDTHS